MRPGDSIDDLDTRIALAEQRLIARQQRLRTQLALLGEEVHQTLRPQRLLAPAATGAVTVLTLGWWLARRRKAARLGRAGRAASPRWRIGQGAAAATAGLPWVQMLGLAGPLLGLARKLLASGRQARASPALARGDPTHPVVDATPLDRERWAGRWLVKAATPVRQASRTPAAADVHYLLRPDGGFDIVRRSVDFAGRLRVVRGVAQPVPGSGGARMRIRFGPGWLGMLPMSWDDHWVLHVDDDYAAALVGQPGGRGLSLLTRDRDLPDERVQRLLRLARERGDAVDRLRFTGIGRAPG